MNKQRRTYFLISAAIAAVFVVVVIFFFWPDMSGTLVNTIPEYPPESNSLELNHLLSGEPLNVSRENVSNVIAAMSRPNEYYLETQSTLSHSSGSSSFFRKRWVKGDISRVDIVSQAGTTDMHYLYSGKKVYIWTPSKATPFVAERGSFNPDDAQMLMSYEDIISADKENIITAQLTVYDGVSCIYAEVKNPPSGYIERYWVSISTGLLVFGQTLDENGSVIYTITATQTDISPQAPENFILPDGTTPT